MCPPPWLEVPRADGGEWRLPDACDYAAFCALLRKMRKGKAASLDRVSKEMLELLPDDLRRAFYEAAMGVATPDEQDVRLKPEYWSRVPVKLLNKKVPSPVVEKKRDIGLPSQLLKLQAGLYLPAYAAVMDRIPANFGWTPGVAARGAALCGGLVLDHAHLLSHLLIVIYGDIRRFFPSMDRDFILISEQWRGLPRDVREATLALYDDSCILGRLALPDRSAARVEVVAVPGRAEPSAESARVGGVAQRAVDLVENEIGEASWSARARRGIPDPAKARPGSHRGGRKNTHCTAKGLCVRPLPPEGCALRGERGEP
jgi:hypothetical protein